jgi:hypothetical protein
LLTLSAFVFFPKEVQANRQLPVIDLTLMDYTAPTGTTYSIAFTWSRPIASQVAERNHTTPPTRATHYDLMMRNISRGQQFGQIPEIHGIASNPADMNDDSDRHYSTGQQTFQLLDSGTLYGFRIRPYHIHVWQTPNAQGGFTQDTAPATLDTSIPQNEALFLTDISVSAQGSGNTFTVVWDAPLFEGRHFFDGYNIYYQEIGMPGSDPDPRTSEPPVFVAANNPNLRLIDGGRRFEYTFEANNIHVGRFYAVAVEPTFNGVEIRNSDSGFNGFIVFNNIRYFLEFTNRKYQYNHAYVSPTLEVVQEGEEFIRLVWDRFTGSQLATLQTIRIFERRSPGGQWELLGLLEGNNAQNQNSWLTHNPRRVMFYYLVVDFLDPLTGIRSQMESRIAVFDPSIVSFRPYRPDIVQITNSPPPVMPPTMTVQWEAFFRRPHNDDERQQIDPAFPNMYIDRNIVYDMWVTDNIDNFENQSFINTQKLPDIPALGLNMIRLSDGTPTFTHNITQYTHTISPGVYETRTLTDNKIYYVRIMARRTTNQGEDSRPASVRAHYIPPFRTIVTAPNMMARPPLRIKTDENGVHQITFNSIGVEWDTIWYEWYDANEDRWFSRWPTGTNTFVDLTMRDGEDELTGLNRIRGVINDPTIAVRRIDLNTPVQANYQVHIVLFDDMARRFPNVTQYEQYLHEINNDPTAWTDINVRDADTTTPYFIMENLEENTAYVIFVRPYLNMNGQRLYAYFPNFIMGTTLSDRPPIDIVPTIPLINLHDITDQTATLRWEYSKELIYELRWSDILSQYPSAGNAISWAEIEEGMWVREENGREFAYFTVTGLFPQTQYFFWLRAGGRGTQGQIIYSGWSNPVNGTTRNIQPPLPPDGLGLASLESLNIYNRINDTQIQRIEHNYMVIEWMRDARDVGEGGSASGTNWRTLEIPDNDLTYLVQFTNLRANTPYYVRAKTILTVTRTGTGVTSFYNYVVQFSLSSDFIDVIEATVPPFSGEINTNPALTIRAESDWSRAFVFFTGLSEDEYDGHVNPRHYPLPTEDFEIIYRAADRSLYFRMRSDGVDRFGNRDNHVDQRVITRLIQERTFNYTVDMTRFDDMPIVSRSLELPRSVIEAFNVNRISLTVVADNATFVFPPGTLREKVVLNVHQTGEGFTGHWDDEFLSSPQRLTVTEIFPRTTAPMMSFAQPISVDMRVRNRAELLDRNVNAYIGDRANGEWRLTPSRFDNANGSYNISTTTISSYTVIGRPLPVVVDGGLPGQQPSIHVLNDLAGVFARIDIPDMGSYNPDARVTANQFNNLIAAVANNRPSVRWNTQLSSADFDALGKGRMLVSGNFVTREAGLASLIRLYEVKTGRAISGVHDLRQSGVTDIFTVAPGFVPALLKAEHIGLVGFGAFEPKREMTVGELFELLADLMNDW